MKKENTVKDTTKPMAYDALLCPVFKCKCGCNNFAFVGEIPECTEDGFTTGEVDDVLYVCIDCGDNYYLSELNGA